MTITEQIKQAAYEPSMTADDLRRLLWTCCDWADGLERLLERQRESIRRVLDARQGVADGKYDQPEVIQATADRIAEAIATPNADVPAPFRMIINTWAGLGSDNLQPDEIETLNWERMNGYDGL